MLFKLRVHAPMCIYTLWGIAFLAEKHKSNRHLDYEERRRKEGNGKSWYEREENEAKLSATKYFFISLLVCGPSSTAYCLLPADVHGLLHQPLAFARRGITSRSMGFRGRSIGWSIYQQYLSLTPPHPNPPPGLGFGQ